MTNSASKKYFFIFLSANLAFVLAKILFTFRPELDLFTEEAQYWLWSRNLAWHYYSKPPMVAVLNFISTTFFGHTELAVRITPAILGFCTAWVVYLFARHLYNSEKIACISAIIFLGMPIHLLEFTFHTTDSSMTFFWTLSWYALYRAISSGNTSTWVIAGLVTALGIMSKTTMILIFPASLIYLDYTGKLKSSLTPWMIFLMVSLLGFLPSFIWNVQNDFYTFKHLASLGGASGGEASPFNFWLSVKRLSEYLVEQVLMVSIFFFPLFVLGFKKLLPRIDTAGVYVLLPGILTLAGFALLSLFSRIEVNWPGFAYSTFPIFLAQVVANSTHRWKAYGKWAIGLSFLLPFLLLLPNISGWKSSGPLFHAEKALYKRTTGYDQLGARLDFLMDSLNIHSPVIFSDSYHFASELAFYTRGQPHTFVAKMGSRKNQWDLWPGLHQFIDQPKNLIFVSKIQPSPESVARFQRKIYEEEVHTLFGKDTLGKTNIQIWEKLLDYRPVDQGKF
jgi:hypothetical protein